MLQKQTLSADIAYVYGQIKAAHNRIKDRIIETEIIRLPWLDAPNRKVWAKLECRQISGSFKIRGAFNTFLQTPASDHVITYSAGNHGLAMAMVAQQLERQCTIYVPSNVSELKLRKLLSLGAHVETVGSDLYESSLFAKEKAAVTGAHFVTPHSTPDIVYGQGTIGAEIAAAANRMDSLVIPLGGGGLMCGIGTYMKHAFPDHKLFAPYPEIFGRNLRQGNLHRELCRKVIPTVADGLSVQVEENCWTVPLLESMIESHQAISEKLINTAIYALLRNESILAEGGGAIGVAMLMDDPSGERISGDTLVVISGGNIAPGAVSKVMATSIYDHRFRKLLGLRAIKIQGEMPVKAEGETTAIQPQKAPDLQPLSTPSESLWVSLLKQLGLKLKALEDEVATYVRFLNHNQLQYDAESIKNVRHDMAACIFTVEQLTTHSWQKNEDWLIRSRYRELLQKYAYLANVFEWTSPSYDQSQVVMFFNPSEQSSNMVNYDRYGSIVLRKFELSLLETLGFDTHLNTMIATSSGQAAYQVIESFLLREVFDKEDLFVYSEYIYFEGFEQLSLLPFLEAIKCEGHSHEDLIEVVEKNNAKVVFADPMCNMKGLPVFDFAALSQSLRGRNWSEKWLVIDGTMVSGGFNPFSLFNRPEHPHIIYYESASKYLQFGLDLQMAGICICEKKIAPALSRYRRNSGSTMYRSGVNRFPVFTRDLFLRRMQLISQNAEHIARALKDAFSAEEQIKVGFPFQWSQLQWRHPGAVLNIEFIDEGLNNRDQLNMLVEIVINKAQQAGVSVSKGVSFGFSTTRISAASAMAENTDPFFRLSVGEENEEELNKLTNVLINSVDEYLNLYQA